MTNASPNDPGREPYSFPSTLWSRVRGREGGERTRDDLEALFTAYARPVVAYLRARFRLDPETALDHAQDFFVRVLEGDFLDRADRERGRFRTFLTAALDRFVIDRAREKSAQKRGGDRIHLSLAGESGEHAVDLPDPRTATPAEILDRAYRREIVTRSLDELRERLACEGKETYFRVFDELFLREGEPDDHATVAARHGLTASDVSNHLRAVKKRYRAILRRRVRETVASDEDLEDELRWLTEEEKKP